MLDGWSMAIVLADVLAAYRVFSKGGEPDLPRPRPYRAFIDWLSRQDVAQAEEGWRRVVEAHRTAEHLRVFVGVGGRGVAEAHLGGPLVGAAELHAHAQHHR